MAEANTVRVTQVLTMMKRFFQFLPYLLAIQFVGCEHNDGGREGKRSLRRKQEVARPVDPSTQEESKSGLSIEDEEYLRAFFHRTLQSIETFSPAPVPSPTQPPTSFGPSEKPAPDRTPSPSPSPSALSTPTFAPTDAPEPTDAPVRAPTDSPTSPVESEPTDVPVPAPTDLPSPAPVTAEPTHLPTLGPVDAEPTGIPTPSPVEPKPTNAPMSPPTGQPTLSPIVVEPTDAPVSSPTGLPTLTPVVLEPTDAPVVAPTDLPSFTPVVQEPEPEPSLAPSTVEPTLAPQELPLPIPTSPMVPPSAPVPQVSTAVPTVNPTAMPTQSATASPTIVCNQEDELRALLIRVLINSVSDSVLVGTEGTPQNMAMEWLINQDKRRLCPSDPSLKRRYSLATFYFSTRGTRWSECSAPDNLDDPESIEEANAACTIQPFPDAGTDAWLTPSSECRWGGVYCDESGEVQLLDIGKAAMLIFRLVSFATSQQYSFSRF